MDINNLTITQVQQLVEEEKNPQNVLEYRDVYDQIVSSLVYSAHTYRCQVIDRIRIRIINKKALLLKIIKRIKINTNQNGWCFFVDKFNQLKEYLLVSSTFIFII